MAEKIVPFQDWRPLTPEEHERVPRAFWWLRVSRRRAQPEGQQSDGPRPPAQIIEMPTDDVPRPEERDDSAEK